MSLFLRKGCGVYTIMAGKGLRCAKILKKTAKLSLLEYKQWHSTRFDPGRLARVDLLRLEITVNDLPAGPGPMAWKMRLSAV
jgi:hypothetical protein